MATLKLSRLPDGSPEIFHTLQGEGPSLGRPAVFLRLALCNLHCQWCDTPYTWNWKGTPWEHQDGTKFEKKANLLELDAEEVAKQLTDLPALPLLILTGGEPLLQEKGLESLLTQLASLHCLPEVEVETNGTQLPSPAIASRVTRYNVSPKLRNSGMPSELRLRPDALSWFAEQENAIFKFVITSPSDLEEVAELRAAYAIPVDRISLMPEGRNAAEVTAGMAKLAPICLQAGYRLSPRLHVLLWGDKRAR